MIFAAKGSRAHGLLPGWLVHFGIAGLFGIALFDASPVPAPLPAAPDILIIFLGAQGEWPWLLVLAGVSGSVIGGYLTWATGKKGGEAMLDHYMRKRKRLRARMTGWIRGHGMRTVLIAGLLPPPLPTLPILLGAGALGVTRRQLLVALTLSRTLRYGIEVALAVIYGHRILQWAHHYLSGWADIILYSFLGLVSAAILFGIWKYRRDKHLPDRPGQSAGAHAA